MWPRSRPCLPCTGSFRPERLWSEDRWVAAPPRKRWFLHSLQPSVVGKEAEAKSGQAGPLGAAGSRTTYRCSRSVDFFLQLVQLHFQDLLVWHVPGHPGCRCKSNITFRGTNVHRVFVFRPRPRRLTCWVEGLPVTAEKCGLLRARQPSPLWFWRICAAPVLFIPCWSPLAFRWGRHRIGPDVINPPWWD